MGKPLYRFGPAGPDGIMFEAKRIKKALDGGEDLHEWFNAAWGMVPHARVLQGLVGIALEYERISEALADERLIVDDTCGASELLAAWRILDDWHPPVETEEVEPKYDLIPPSQWIKGSRNDPHIPCVVEYKELENEKGEMIRSVTAMCTRCGKKVIVFGAQRKSVGHLFGVLRKKCLRGEHNWYFDRKRPNG